MAKTGPYADEADYVVVGSGSSGAAVAGRLAQSGASVIVLHIERIYVHETRYEEFRDRFVAAAGALELGATYDFGPELGSLISVDHRDGSRPTSTTP